MRSRLLSITSYGDGAHYIWVLWQWWHVVRRNVIASPQAHESQSRALPPRP